MTASSDALRGKRIVITRPQEQAGEFVAQLKALGAVPVTVPTIRLAPPPDWRPVDAAIERLDAFEWVVFTSANGVRFVAARLRALDKTPPVFKANRLAAIGPATAAALKQLGERVDFVPSRYLAEAIADELDEVAGQRFLLLRADIARTALREQLQAKGASVTEVAVYSTATERHEKDALKALIRDGIDVVTFTSASTVSGLTQLLGGELDDLRRCMVACIGPITAKAAVDAGLTPAVVAVEHTVPGLIQAIQEAIRDGKAN